MSHLEADPHRDGEPPEAPGNLDMGMAVHRQSAVIRDHIQDSMRMMELEIENTRLHRLVAELLIKNEKLRKPD
jgi:23S rRNA maturation-related 3'-5' exoribonuclease YhaM